MAYTPTTWNTGDDVTATKLNKLEQGVANAGDLKYDIVVVYDNTVYPSTCEVIKGDILDCEDKMDMGELVNGICILKGAWSFTPSGTNTPNEGYYLPLSAFSGPYHYMSFGALFYNGGNWYGYNTHISYNPNTGAIDSFTWQVKNL